MVLSTLYKKKNRLPCLTGAAVLILLIALVDWQTKPYISIGFLYLFPLILVAGHLTRWQLILAALACAVLQETFSELPSNEAVARLVMASTGFVGTGLFLQEILRHRQAALDHMAELEEQTAKRKEVEEQLRVLVESSPVAIITVDADGTILLANEASRDLLDPDGPPLQGRPMTGFLPALQSALKARADHAFRTELRCRATRANGEMFMAAVWFSTFVTANGLRLAAIIVDLSEELRDREELGLDHLLKNTKIVMSAIAHEIRNLSGAGLVVHRNLAQLPALQDNADFQALGTLIQGLEKLSAMELLPSGRQPLAPVDLSGVLDEFRVILDPACREVGVELAWALESPLPLVHGDPYGISQALLNLCRNALTALAGTETKRLSISVDVVGPSVAIRVEDTGGGVLHPELLFKPFQQEAGTTGLGLYVSRALLRSFGGDLIYEPSLRGSRFIVLLPSMDPLLEPAP